MVGAVHLAIGVLAAGSAFASAETRPASPATAPAGELAIRNGDVVVFIGDELTDAPQPHRSSNFPILVETFMTVRYPELRVRYVNTGWSGDTVERALLRFDRDVLVHQPTVVVICLGLNDPDYQTFSEARLEAFKEGLSALVERCREAGARTWLISPPSVDEQEGKAARIRRDGKPSVADLGAIAYNETLVSYAAAIKEIAAAAGNPPAVGFVDWFNESMAARAEARKNQSDFSFSRDGRIPQARGHALIAAALLRAWGAQPIRVTIDLDWQKATAQIAVHGSKPMSVPVVTTEEGQRMLELEGLPLPWPMAGGRVGHIQSNWEAASMCQFIFRMADPPKRIVLTQETPEGSPGGKLPILGEQLRAGFDLAPMPVLQSLKELTELYRTIGTKNYYRYRTWRHLELVPPREPELADAQRQLTAAWNAFVAGYEQIIARMPKTFDAKFILAEPEPTELLPVSRPGRPRTPTTRPVRRPIRAPRPGR